MIRNNVSYYKATALDDAMLRHRAPSVFASSPMSGLSCRYAFVPTIRIVDGLRDQNWTPVTAEEQRVRKETRRGFQKHMLRFRRIEQMETVDEWNVELVLINSHDAGCAYQIHAGIYRRICSNGLVLSQDTFQALRFRHTGWLADEVVQASFRLLDQIPRVGAMVERFRQRELAPSESLALASHALVLRYGNLTNAPVEPRMLLEPRRPEDVGPDLWTTMSRVQEHLVRGGLSDFHRDRRGRLRSVRALRGIDAKVDLNKSLWSLAERLVNGQSL